MRALRSSQRLHELVGGSDGLMVLPLHDGLPPSQQSRVLEARTRRAQGPPWIPEIQHVKLSITLFLPSEFVRERDFNSDYTFVKFENSNWIKLGFSEPPTDGDLG